MTCTDLEHSLIALIYLFAGILTLGSLIGLGMFGVWIVERKKAKSHD